MPDIKPRCSKSSNHSDPNSAEAPTCIPTFNTKHMHQNVAEQQVTKDKLHFKGECKCFAELKHKYIKEPAGVEYWSDNLWNEGMGLYSSQTANSTPAKF